jgi:hypothetical protein
VSKTIETPIEVLEEMCDLRFPAQTDARMQQLMDRNNEGLLTPQEREELESLVEVSQRMSLIRAHALKLLGRSLP